MSPLLLCRYLKSFHQKFLSFFMSWQPSLIVSHRAHSVTPTLSSIWGWCSSWTSITCCPGMRLWPVSARGRRAPSPPACATAAGRGRRPDFKKCQMLLLHWQFLPASPIMRRFKLWASIMCWLRFIYCRKCVDFVTAYCSRDVRSEHNDNTDDTVLITLAL